MTDVFSNEGRSLVMRSVKSAKNKSTELRLIRIFKKLRITGWRRGYEIFGRPDFVFPKHKLVVFTDGCFWHGHNCRNLKPKNNKSYWHGKIKRNKERDNIVSNYLRGKNWRVFRIWECDLKREKLSSKFLSALKG